MVKGCGAGFVARKFATDGDLADTLAEAIAHPGFALVEIAELCTVYGTRLNKLSGKRLKETVERQNYKTGTLLYRKDRKEFGLFCKERCPRAEVSPAEDFLPLRFRHDLTKRVGLIISGTAGERVQS